MRILKNVPWMTHRATSANPRAELLAEATRQAADTSVCCLTPEYSKASRTSLIGQFVPERIISPGRPFSHAHLPGIVHTSPMPTRSTALADSDLLMERC
jgi:hypothetical protein